MSDYTIVNSPEYLNAITAIGPGARMLRTRIVKKRFDPEKPRGFAEVWDDDKRLRVRWDAFSGWQAVTHDVGDGETATHYGILHLVAPVPNGLTSWRIEDLRRPGEAAGTDSVWVDDWPYARDVWGVMLYDKWHSPVRDRGRENPLFRLPDNSLCAVWVSSWNDVPGSPEARHERRSDLAPIRYKGHENGAPEPPQEPRTPVEPYPGNPPESTLDDMVRSIFKRGAELMR